MRYLRSIATVALALLVLLGVPALRFFGLPFADGGADAVSSASLALPDQPSGDFLVLLNTTLHPDTVEQWAVFFAGGDAGVIMSDISCVSAQGDASAAQLALRYAVRLPENQMRLREENATLLASKVESGAFDAAVFSAEMAELCGLNADRPDVLVVRVRGD